MADYAFVTLWRVEAPIETVYEAIHDTLTWPSWWDAVTNVEELDPGDADGIGAVRRYVFKSRLPYTLGFDMRVDRVERPTILSGRATGELEGLGLWTLRGEGRSTIVRYDWQIRTNRWWMNLFAPFPFVRQIFEINHDYAMERGRVGLAKLLGVRVWRLQSAGATSRLSTATATNSSVR